MANRIPLDPQYTSVVGRAVYVFAYYEWAIIYLIQRFRPGFVSQYCRGTPPLTSGVVERELRAVVDDPTTSFSQVSRCELQACYDKFASLVAKRNALIHAHPITDCDGSQMINYQSATHKPLPDMKWPIAEVKALLAEFDDAACRVNELFYRL